MQLAIDVGNTSVKCGVFEDRKIVEVYRFEESPISGFEEIISGFQIDQSVLSYSGADKYGIENWLQKNNVPNLLFKHGVSLPISVAYETPETLGRDRLAGAVAAWTLFPNQTNLVIDMGTCITTNVINGQGAFLGGTISPGVAMRAKAMHEFTAALPLVSLQFPKGYIGTTTETSMQNGILRGTYFEIQALIDWFIPVFGINNVILTGGGANFFANLLNFKIFAFPNLVLTGLNEILLYNR